MPDRDKGFLPAEELALLIDTIEDYAIFLLTPDGHIRSWNSGARRIMGYEAADALGRHFSIFYPDEDRAAGKPEHELEVASSAGRIEDEGWRVRKDGTRFWVNTVITAVRDKSGQLTGFAKVTRDLTNRREAEESLRQSEEVFRLLVASVKDYAIFLLDADGRVMTWNAGAERIKGYAPSEIIGKHFSLFYPEEDLAAGKPERNLQVAREKGSVEEEGWRLRKDGTRFWADVIITAVYDEQHHLRGYAKVTRDLTERRRAEEERQHVEASWRAEQEANRAKDEFLMTLSHELRTPLTAILGWSRLLPSLSPADHTFNDAISAISRSAEAQARLIDDVLDVSRITSGKLRLNTERIDLLRLLSASVETVRPSADAKSISISTMFAPQLGTMTADPTRLQQIVWNLLTNAVKFTPTGGRVELTARRVDGTVEIVVSDTGEGIDPAFLPHVFDPFRQAEEPHTRVHGGLGLGLSIVRYLAEAHGGTIRAESAGKGKGASFTVTLPAAATMQMPRNDVTRIANTIASAALAGMSIVLVDDDDAGRLMIATALRQAGADVTDVGSAAAALDAVDRRRPDLVVTDIAMPNVDGYELARQLAVNAPGLKIVALSAFSVRRGTADNLFKAYIGKPIDPDRLVQDLQRVIAH